MTMGDGARLATWTVSAPGPGSCRPPVILVHGGPGLWDYLEPLGHLLGGLCTVHRYDQRGCGRSSASEELTMQRYVADLEELRVRFGHERVVVVGHSFGATLALAYAGTHPKRVAGLGYLDGTGIGDWRTAYRAERDRRRAPWASRFADLDGRDRTHAEEVEWRRISWAPDYADPRAGYDLALEMARAPMPINHVANRSLMAFGDADQIGWATAATCPITFVHGTADPRPAANVSDLATYAHRPRRRVVDGAGHLPWLEQPERTREILEEIVLTADP
ncbi:alpha/beta fold hydrolase [Occultella glacieicola]|nr:alpha/beta hydrolase [Occultella glacieicola]